MKLNLNIPRIARDAALLTGLGLIVGGIAWLNVACAFVAGGFVLVCMAVAGMIFARRG